MFVEFRVQKYSEKRSKISRHKNFRSFLKQSFSKNSQYMRFKRNVKKLFHKMIGFVKFGTLFHLSSRFRLWFDFLLF